MTTSRTSSASRSSKYLTVRPTCQSVSQSASLSVSQSLLSHMNISLSCFDEIVSIVVGDLATTRPQREWPTTCHAYRCQWRWWPHQGAPGLREKTARRGPPALRVHRGCRDKWVDKADQEDKDSPVSSDGDTAHLLFCVITDWMKMKQHGIYMYIYSRTSRTCWSKRR